MMSFYAASRKQQLKLFQLGDFKLDSGDILPNAFIAYKTHGDASNPAVINPTWYTGKIDACAKLISTNNVSLNPEKYYLIVPALIGNGESISPSNTPALRHKFPPITFRDNVRAQHRLVTEALGINHVLAVYGWSMGGGQAYQWAVQFPDFMDVIVASCASARTAVHNNVFLEGVKSALITARCGTSAGIGKGQKYPFQEPWSDIQREAGLKAFARVYAGWGFSQAWYREGLYRTHYQCEDAEEFMVKFWEAWAMLNEPDDLLVMLQTWQLGDISASAEFRGDLAKALRSIKAKVLVTPAATDLYFPPEDSRSEVESMVSGNATLAVIPTIWGHWAGGPGDSKEDWEFLDEQMGKAFSEAMASRPGNLSVGDTLLPHSAKH